MRLFLSISLFLVVAGCDLLPSSSPSPSDTPLRTSFGTEQYDVGNALLERPNGEILVAGIGGGVVAPADGTLPTPSLAKLHPDGRLIWSHVYDRLRYAEARAVLEYGDGYLLLISRTDDRSDYGGGVQGLMLALWEVDAEGTLVQPLYQRPGTYAAYGASRPLLATRDGGFVLLGEARNDEGSGEAFVVGLSASGSTVWEQRFDDAVELNTVLEAADGDLLLAGTHLQTGTDRYGEDLFLARTSADGTVRWTRTYGAPGEVTRGFAMAAAPDGGYVVAGMQTRQTEADYGEFAYALRVDEAGDEQWSATYGDAEVYHRAASITATPNGGFALAGSSQGPTSASKVYFSKISDAGEQMWARRVGSTGKIEFANALLARPDGSLILTGATGPDEPSYGGADFDVLVLLTDAEGDAP